jgi:predicted HicB family RNase H-like nuclease
LLKRMNYLKFGTQMKNTKLNIRITETEKKQLKDQAKDQGITLSKLVLQSVRMSKS